MVARVLSGAVLGIEDYLVEDRGGRAGSVINNTQIFIQQRPFIPCWPGL